MSVFLCGPEAGAKRKYRCPCCEREWNDPEAMAVAMCHECVWGSIHCRRCVEDGMVRGTIGREGRRQHIIVTIRKGNRRWLNAACGKVVDWTDMWSGFMKRPCRKCERAWADWPRRVA